MPNDTTLHTFETPAAFASIGKVDTAENVIRDVSMITGNLEAKGHGLQVDATTLKQIHQCSEKKGKVPVKLDHGSGVKDVNGFLTNFRTVGTKQLADWHLLASHTETPKLLEMAARQPETFGLSVAFRGDPETTDGKTVFQDEKTKAYYTLGANKTKHYLKANEARHARCTELVSCDLVTAPAANPEGLFSVPVDTHRFDMPEDADNSEQGGGQDPLEAILAKLEAIEAMIEEHDEALHAVIGHLSGEGEPDGDEKGEGEGHEMGAQGALTQLSAQQYLDQRFNQFIQGITDQQEQETLFNQFEELKAGQWKLVTELEASRTREQVLTELNTELRENNGALSAASGSPAVNLFQANPNAGAQPAEGMTKFEAEVTKTFNEFSAKPEFAGKTPKEVSFSAMKHVIATKSDLHKAHLREKGAR
jgi:hypothetical protein